MRAHVALLAFLALAAATPPAVADEGGSRQRVVVYRLTADEGLEDLAAQLGEEVLVALGAAPELAVMGESELEVLLAHVEDRRALLCEDVSACAARLSEVVDADRLVTGHVGRVGAVYVVSLKLVNVRKAAVERAEAAQAASPEALVGPTREAALRVLGLAAATGPRFQMEVAAGGTRAAVLDVAAHGVPEELAQNLTQLLVLELRRFEGLSVISRGEIQAMLRFETERQILSCTQDTSCLVEIGGALGVDYIVSGSVGALGDAYVVTLNLMDIHRAEVVNRASQSFRGAVSDLAAALRFATWELLGRPVDGAGTLRVSANVEEGELTVDGSDPLAWPLAAPIEGLPVGKHALGFRAEGYETLFRETYVAEGILTDVDLELQELPEAWYEKWWTWTIVGAVVVGAGVTTAVLLTRDGAGSGSVTATIR